MPELPEVEAARRALEAHCVGRRIARCAVADDPKIVVAGAGVTHVAFERTMVGRTTVAARRRGKNLWIRLDAPPFPFFQFGSIRCKFLQVYQGRVVKHYNEAYKRSSPNSSSLPILRGNHSNRSDFALFQPRDFQTAQPKENPLCTEEPGSPRPLGEKPM